MKNINIESERKFENQKVNDHNIRKREGKFYKAVSIPYYKHDKKVLDFIRDKKILEIGCSYGINAASYIKVSESFNGCDISDIAIAKARTSFPSYSEQFTVCDAHKLPFKNASFEVVIVNSLLHHLDMEIGLKEISRVLMENGHMCFREPLNFNLVHNIYRLLTPSSRTRDEKPLGLKELQILRKYFIIKDVTYFGGLNLLSVLIRNEKMKQFLTSVDNYLSKTFFRYFFWQFSGIVKKR